MGNFKDLNWQLDTVYTIDLIYIFLYICIFVYIFIYFEYVYTYVHHVNYIAEFCPSTRSTLPGFHGFSLCAVKTKSIPSPNAPCMDYIPTLGEKWLHSRGNVGKYSLHGASGITLFGRWIFPELEKHPPYQPKTSQISFETMRRSWCPPWALCQTKSWCTFCRFNESNDSGILPWNTGTVRSWFWYGISCINVSGMYRELLYFIRCTRSFCFFFVLVLGVWKIDIKKYRIDI